MPTAQDSADTAPDDGARQSFASRLLALPAGTISAARSRPLLSFVLLCGATMISASGVSVAYYLITRGPSSDRNVNIHAALALLDKGEYDEARQMAHRLSKRHQSDLRLQGQPLYVQGVALYNQASNMGRGPEYQTICLVAARYLQESQSRGFPAGRETEGLYILGNALFDAGHYAESLPALRDTLEAMPHQKYDTARRLSTAYLRDSTPDYTQALHFNRLWLENPSLRATERDEALAQLAEIELARGAYAACHDALAQVNEDSPVHDQALVLQAQLAIQEGDNLTAKPDEPSAAADAQDQYRKAIEHLQRAQSKGGAAAQRSQYLLGVCYQKLGDLRAAKQAFERTRQKYYRTPEALAAMLTEAEIAHQQDRDEIALDLYLRVLEEASDAELYQTNVVGLEELRDRLSVGHQQFLLKNEFQMALDMANAFEEVFPADGIAAAKAKTLEAWAEQLLAEAGDAGNVLSEVKRAAARSQFRRAGTEYRQLAELRFATSEYPNDLWKSGHCYLRGQNYRLAIEVLQQHLNNAPSKQAAQGMVGLGESHLALGECKTALNVLHDCIASFPKHPASYRARLLASHAHREIGELKDAEEHLIDNLHRTSLTPRSRHWQDSLLAYGKLLFQRARNLELQARGEMAAARKDPTDLAKRNSGLAKLKEANDLFSQTIATLEESVQRELQTANEQDREPTAYEAKYFIAEAYRHSANLPSESLAIEPTQTRRIMLRQQMRTHLQAAATAHRDLQAQLARKQNVTELSLLEKRLLRNTYFAYADSLFSLEDYDEAINAYVVATNRYQHEPEGLEALLQIASCYRRLGSPVEARGTMLQAQSVLRRIPQDADFKKTTRYDRTQWEQLIDWLAKL